MFVRIQDCKIGGEQNFVGVGGVQSSVGAGARGDGGTESRHGGVVARFSHINMHRVLIEEKRCMLSGVPSKLIDMKQKVSFNSSVGCVDSDVGQPINQQQQQQQQDNNNHDDDEVTNWNDVESCVDVGVGGGKSGSNRSRHGLGENEQVRFVRGFECFESIADITTTTTKRQRRNDDDDDDNDSTTSHAQHHGLDEDLPVRCSS